jgi:uncharacterized protein YndB with AHSA1/START domain
MRYVKIFLSVVVVLMGLLLAFAVTRPDTFRVERSITVNAPPERVLAEVQDFHRWASWSPWEKLDPALQKTFSGSPSGVGAVYEWTGNQDAGRGRMEVIEVSPPTHLRIRLDFFAPFEAHNEVEFLLKPQGAQTVVTQAMYGPQPFIVKLMGLVFNMDKTVGGKYEEGLAALQATVER